MLQLADRPDDLLAFLDFLLAGFRFRLFRCGNMVYLV
jgi:hypothetical protein